MADGAMVAFPAAILVGEDFVGLALVDHLGGDAGAAEIGSDLGVFAIRVEENLGKGHAAADFGVELLDVNEVTLGNAVLFTAGFDDCVWHRIGTGKLVKKGR